ncbi:MAG: hypothetical protein ACJ76V_11570 [Thermoleophilaceae bacterium]
MRKWPPIVWTVLAIASLYILSGTGKWRHWELIAGGILAAIGLGLAVYVALAPWPGRPRPRFVTWTVAGTAVFYVLMGVLAGQAGPEYAVAGLAAGVFPLAAAALLVATARAKTLDRDGRLVDASREADRDPYPGIGLDAETPLGDNPDLSPVNQDPEFHPAGRFQLPRRREGAARRR